MVLFQKCEHKSPQILMNLQYTRFELELINSKIKMLSSTRLYRKGDIGVSVSSKSKVKTHLQ